MSVRLARLAQLLAFPLATWGCTADPADADAGDEHEHEHEHDAEVGCAAETRDDEYRLGMEKVGTALTVRFVDALPAPPDRGDNSWTIEVLDAATGTPRSDVALVVEPFMVDHNHGTPIECNVTPLDAPGQLKLEPINLWMPGLWEVRLHFTLPDDTPEQINFSFCVDP